MTDSYEIDILELDEKIKKNFVDEKLNLEEYKDKLADIVSSLNLNVRNGIRDKLLKTRDELTEFISSIENNTSLNFYILESADLLEKYKDILNLPMKMSFTGKASKHNKQKIKIIEDYIDIANKYVSINISVKKKDKIICSNCNNKEFDIEDENLYICVNCSAQQFILKNISSYKDIDRINISSKYIYDRKVHFRDNLNQYQGKQNCTINQKVYDELENQFRLHHLLCKVKEEDKYSKFDDITKEHVSIFLKELGYTKHYENVNLIHYNMTGKKPDDIGHLEDKLLEEFDMLTDMYDKKFKHLDRKNFINTNYVLYQLLLLKHKHPCKKEDFSALKTIDRQNFHDDVCRVLFTELGWSFSDLY